MSDSLGKACPVGTAELGPFSKNEDSIGVFSGLVRTETVGDVRKFVFCLLHSLWVVCANAGALSHEAFRDVQGGSKSHVIGIRLECQSPNREGFATQDPEFFLHFCYELLSSSQIDLLDFFEQREVTSKAFADANESLKIFGETKTTEADTGIQEGLSDTLIAADALGYLGDVRASRFTCISHQIDERNLHGQERVGGMLYKFGAICVGHNQRHFMNGRTMGMNRASSGRRQNWPVDFLHHRDSTWRFRSDHNTIGMEKISNRGSFAEKLRVRHNVKTQSVNVINGEMFPQTLCGLYRDGALFDDQAISMRRRGNRAGDRFNGTEIRFPVVQRRSANTDENSSPLFDGFCRGHESQAS